MFNRTFFGVDDGLLSLGMVASVEPTAPPPAPADWRAGPNLSERQTSASWATFGSDVLATAPSPSEPNFRPQASRPLSAETGRSYLTESNDVRPSGMPRDRPHVHLGARARVQATAEDGRQDIVRRRMTSPRPVRFMQTRMTDHRSAISPQSGAGCPQGCGSSHRTGRRPGIAIKFAQPGAFAGGIGHDKTGGGGETPGGRSCGVSLPAGPSERM